MTTVLIAAPLVIASPIAVFILWDSLGHWKTTSLTFGEYYYLPLAIFRSYLLIAYGIELVLVLPLVLLLRVRARKNAGQGRMGTDRMSCDGRAAKPPPPLHPRAPDRWSGVRLRF